MIQRRRRRAKPEAPLAVAVALAFGLAPVVPLEWQALPLALAVIATTLGWLRRSALVVHAGIVALVTMSIWLVPAERSFWPLSLVVAIAVDLAATALVPWLRGTLSFAAGRFDRRVVVLGLAIAAVTSGLLLAWVLLAQPDLRHLAARVPSGASWPVLAAGALVYSVLNASAEEWAFRGVLTGALDTSLGHARAADVVQALAFGMLHYHGLPGGAIGVLGGTAYGLALAAVRRTSGGLVPAIAVHVLADLTIVAVVASHA